MHSGQGRWKSLREVASLGRREVVPLGVVRLSRRSMPEAQDTSRILHLFVIFDGSHLQREAGQSSQGQSGGYVSNRRQTDNKYISVPVRASFSSFARLNSNPAKPCSVYLSLLIFCEAAHFDEILNLTKPPLCTDHSSQHTRGLFAAVLRLSHVL